MLEIVIKTPEKYDSKNNLFIEPKEQLFQLEHSLISLQKWESKWNKPFLSKGDKTFEETIDYIRCMTINKNVDFSILYEISNENIQQINEYIDAPMTATTISTGRNNKPNREIITAEIIYYWMITLQIPVEFRKWHLNQLLTLIKVCNIKNSPPKKMSKQEIFARNRAMNEANRKRFNSKG